MFKKQTIKQLNKRTMLFLASLLLAAIAGLVLLGWQVQEPKQDKGVALAQGEPRTLVLQNGVEIEGQIYTGVEDTYIYEWQPDRNYDAEGKLSAGRGDMRTLIRFDVSKLPPDANVESATLYLYCYEVSGDRLGEIGLFQIAHGNWSENGATWNKYDGTNSWSTPGGDYDATLIGSWDATDNYPGWTDYDISEVVQGYVDGTHDLEAGFLLASGIHAWKGYDFANFKCSEDPDRALRPKLVVSYTSDFPHADAGPDQEVGPSAVVTLDATNSSDPNQSPEDLIYKWDILSKPWNSGLTDNDISPNNTTGINGADTPTFAVDALGDYEIELTVTNSLGFSSLDTMKVSNRWEFFVTPEHPRIWLTAELLATLRERAAANTSQWQRFKGIVDNDYDPMGDWSYIISNALVYQVTNDTQYSDKAIQRMNDFLGYDISRDAGYDARWIPPNVAIGFDWCYDRLTEEDKARFINQLNDWRDVYLAPGAWHVEEPSGNYFYGYLLAEGLSGYATYGDNPRAMEFIDDARWYRFEEIARPALDAKCRGGDWHEGWSYGTGAMTYLSGYAEAVKTATGENIFKSTPFFEDVIHILLHITVPSFDRIYPGGDWAGNNQDGSIDDWVRSVMLRFGRQFSNRNSGKYAQWWLNNVYTQMDMSIMLWEDFFWYNADIPEKDYRNDLPLTYYSPGTSLLVARSDWNDEFATWVSFKSCEKVVGHSHFDQNSFTVFKGEWLAPDTNLYSQSGIVQDTYVHNSMLIDNKGQRYLNDRHATLEKYESSKDYTYAVGEASGPYNNDYNGYILEDFTREFLYLRPDYVIIFDRVTTVNPSSRKQWLLHSKKEPVISGSLVTSINGQGKLFSKTLLPQDYLINKYPETLGYSDTRAWRIEVEPGTTELAKTNNFLHVLEATDATQAEMTPVQLVNEGNYYGVIIDDPALTYNKVLFSKTTAGDYIVASGSSTPGPNITLTKSADKTQASAGEEITYTIAYQNTGTAEAKNVVITDTIPTGTTYVAGSTTAGGVLSGGVLTWAIPSVSAGSQGSVSFKVKVD